MTHHPPDQSQSRTRQQCGDWLRAGSCDHGLEESWQILIVNSETPSNMKLGTGGKEQAMKREESGRWFRAHCLKSLAWPTAGFTFSIINSNQRFGVSYRHTQKVSGNLLLGKRSLLLQNVSVTYSSVIAAPSLPVPRSLSLSLLIPRLGQHGYKTLFKRSPRVDQVSCTSSCSRLCPPICPLSNTKVRPPVFRLLSMLTIMLALVNQRLCNLFFKCSCVSVWRLCYKRTSTSSVL